MCDRSHGFYWKLHAIPSWLCGSCIYVCKNKMLLNLRERSKRAMSKTVDTPPSDRTCLFCALYMYICSLKMITSFYVDLKVSWRQFSLPPTTLDAKANQQTVKSARQSQFPFFHLRCHLYMYIYFLFLIYYKGMKYSIHKTCNYQCLHFIELNRHMRIKASLF